MSNLLAPACFVKPIKRAERPFSRSALCGQMAAFMSYQAYLPRMEAKHSLQ